MIFAFILDYAMLSIVLLHLQQLYSYNMGAQLNRAPFTLIPFIINQEHVLTQMMERLKSAPLDAL